MVTCFSLIYGLVLLQRLFELFLARRNALFVKSQGGYEAGREHYPFILTIHAAFFLSLLAEVYRDGRLHQAPVLFFLCAFLLSAAFRVWCIVSLGKFWNTRIYIIPGGTPVRRGPYRYIRHPNYLAVGLEILTLPLAFGAVYTAFLFTFLNVLVLRVRIRVEEELLDKFTQYGEYHDGLNRFLPKLPKKLKIDRRGNQIEKRPADSSAGHLTTLWFLTHVQPS